MAEFNSKLVVLALLFILLVRPVWAQQIDEMKPPMLEITGSITIPELALPRVAVSSDGKRLAAPLKDDRLGIWNIATGERDLVTHEGHGWQISELAFSPNGLTLATASIDKTARFWNAKTGKLLTTLKGHEDRLKYAAYSPMGKYFFTSTGKTWPYDKAGLIEARIWNARTGELVSELKGHTNTITHAEFSKDESQILTACDDHTARLWDSASGKELHKFNLGSRAITAVFSHNNDTILTSTSGSRSSYATTAVRRLPVKPPPPKSMVKLWDAKTGKSLLELPHSAGEIDPHPEAELDVRAAFNRDGDQFLTDWRGRVTLWDSSTGKELATLREASFPTPTVVFSPRGDFFVVLQHDQLAELWSVAKRKKIREIEVPFESRTFFQCNERFFSRDGKTFYSLESGDFRWWSLDDLD